MTPSIQPGVTGIAYEQQLVATFPNPPGTFFVSSGTLPTGLTLDAFTGLITGHPRQVGTFLFDIAARDGSEGGLPPGRDANFTQGEKRFVVTVARGEPNFLPQAPFAATYRAPYSYVFDVAGGTSPMSFAVSGGVLPAGVVLTSAGVLGGFPTQVGVVPFSFQVTVTDANGLTDVETFELDVRVKPLLLLTAGALTPAARFFPYSYTLQLASTGGGEPFTWSQVTPIAGEVNLASIGMQVTSDGKVTDTGGGPTVLGPHLFTVRVTDEPGQVATRQLSITVNPGPTLSSVSPKNASTVGTYTATGLNFQPGAILIIKPGVTERLVTTTFVNATTLTFSSPVPKPVNGNGSQPIMVRNPDGGEFTLAGALVFPASNIAFGTKAFLASGLSSTGLDVADVNGDGFADLVHSGTSGISYIANTLQSTAAGLVFHLNLGTASPTFGSLTLDTISYTDVKFADVNTDGKLDIVAIGVSTVRTWLGVGNGTFTTGSTTTLYGPGSPQFPTELTVGKFNNDAVPDIAYGFPHGSYLGWSAVNGTVYTMRGTTNGAFANLDGTTTTLSNSYGVLALAAIDANGDGFTELAAGTGCYPYTGPPFMFNGLGSNGLFSGWSAKGGTITGPYYAMTSGMAVADFLGNGGRQLVTATTGGTYSLLQTVMLHSGSDLSTVLTLTTPGAQTKGVTAVDGDFDLKMDFAVAILDSKIVVYRGSTLAIVATLDAAAGSPSITSPRVGRLASGDVNGDGAPDIVGTTSSWQVNGMASNYGTPYPQNTTGNGGSMGIVFFLNTSN